MSSSESPPKRSFPSFFFGSGLGFFCYHILRNDWVWARLNDQEKTFVKEHNEYWNNNSPGYKNPEEYQGQSGKTIKTLEDRCSTWEGKMIQKFLDAERPSRVLEVGPGSGFYTRQIIDCDAVTTYIATDINVGFLETVKSGISEHPRASEIKTDFVSIDKLDQQEFEVDAIIVLSALHHIPDRPEFIQQITSRLAPGGVLFFYEPTYSFMRVLQLMKSFLLNGWYITKVVETRNNFMTHHFCSVAETRAIARKLGLHLEWYDLKSRLPLPRWRKLVAPFANEMVATLRRPLR